MDSELKKPIIVKEWFRVGDTFFACSNKFIDEFASCFTPATQAVYFGLLRFRWNGGNKAEVSQKILGKRLGINRKTVGDHMGSLEAHNILRVRRRRRRGGTWDHYVYELIEEKYWLHPGEKLLPGCCNRPGPDLSLNQESFLRTLNTKNKNTKSNKELFSLRQDLSKKMRIHKSGP